MCAVSSLHAAVSSSCFQHVSRQRLSGWRLAFSSEHPEIPACVPGAHLHVALCVAVVVVAEVDIVMSPD